MPHVLSLGRSFGEFPYLAAGETSKRKRFLYRVLLTCRLIPEGVLLGKSLAVQTYYLTPG
jgi:hypothetical protein